MGGPIPTGRAAGGQALWLQEGLAVHTEKQA